MGRNIKDGDRVYYKIQSGTIRTGKYEEKTKSVKLANGTIAKPPMVALFKQKSTAEKNPFVKLAAGKVGYEEPEKVKKGRPTGKKTAAEKIKGDKRRKTGKYATEKKETPKPKAKATPKEKRKMYYIEAHMLDEDEENMATSVDWKIYKTTGFKTFLKKSMTKKEADGDMIWDEKDSFADYSISKKLE